MAARAWPWVFGVWAGLLAGLAYLEILRHKPGFAVWFLGLACAAVVFCWRAADEVS